MNKLLFGAIGISLLITAVGWFSYKAGVNSEIAAGVKIIAEYQEKEREVVKELEKAEKKREVIIRDKIKIIRQVVDNCADTDAHPDILLQFRTSGTPKQLLNGRL